MKSPVVTRDDTKVIIECFGVGSAETCEKQIKKVLNNRSLKFIIRKGMRG